MIQFSAELEDLNGPVRTNYAMLRGAFDIAVRDGLPRRNPAAAVERPTVERHKGCYLDAEMPRIRWTLIRTPTGCSSPSRRRTERKALVPLRRLHEVTGRPPAATARLGATRFDPGQTGDRAARDAGVRFPVSGLGHERLTR